MDMNSIIARTLSGFAVKAVAAAVALYAAHSVWVYVSGVFSAVNHALPM